ncbi:MAG: glycosyltransferase [Nanoarchaeota archaeon]|nr:glycosyltransferase [Nanoarchaeota archaeon]
MFTKAYQLEKLIEIFERIGRPDYKLYIIGQLNKSIPEDVAYFNKIKSMAEKTSNIFVEYHVDFDVMLDLYRSSKIFWYSYWMFYGLNIADAQSCGTPAIALRLPEKWGKDNGAAEVICNNLTGFMVDSVSDFYEKSLILLNNQKLWAKMSRAARKNAVERLGEDRFIKLFKKEIESLALAKKS